VLKFRPSAAGKQREPVPPRRSWCCRSQHWIHKGIAKKAHWPAELAAEIFGAEQIAAVDRQEAPAAEAVVTGPGQIQTTLIVAGIGDQIGRHWSAAEPGCHDRNHIADHHHEGIAAADADQPQQRLEQMQHLTLDQFGETAPQAGVAQPTGAEFTCVCHQGDACIPIGVASANKRQGIHLVAAALQCLAKQRTGEVFSMTVAQQQQPRHLRAPASFLLS